PAVVLREADHYCHDPDTICTDLAHLHTALEAGPQALLRAAGTYEDFAAEAGYAWAEPHRHRLRHRLTGALLDTAENTAPHISEALLQHAVRISPHTEQAHHALIGHFLDHGDNKAAAAAYAEYATAMEEIGEEADPEMRGRMS